MVLGVVTKRTPTGSTTNTRSARLLSQELAVICALETYGPDPAGQVQSTLAQQKGVTTPGYGTHLNGRSVLNNLKGIFFRDDDLEQMTFSGTGGGGKQVSRSSASQLFKKSATTTWHQPFRQRFCIKIVSLIFICSGPLGYGAVGTSRKPANKKSSPKMSLTEEKIAGGR